MIFCFFFFFQAEDGIRDGTVTGVQTCALPISEAENAVKDQLRAPSQRTSGAGQNGQQSGAGIDGALASVDPRTGQVVAMVSGKDYQKSQVNLATIRYGGKGFQSGSS